MPRPEGTGMLAERRYLKLNGENITRTPLLVPSFSSKGFPSVLKIIEYSSEVIEGPMLVSAYDIYHNKIKPPFDFPSLIFLDSGGYEAAKDNVDLSDFGERDHFPLIWNQEKHESVLSEWSPSVPSVIISYDHPKDRKSIREQIDRARGMAPGKQGFLREILLKPETDTQQYLKIESITSEIQKLADFQVIGATEKEIGNSIINRMTNIAKLRQALDRAGLDTPIHVFGSLDTVTTPLYFLAGADIFDGLTWLRFAFHEGNTLYKHNYSALHLGADTSARMIDGRCWNNNYYYISELQQDMRRFLGSRDFNIFKNHGEFFLRTLSSVTEALGE